VKRTRLWDRKKEGGFPETKELKRRVRDVIEPGRDLGHVDGKKMKNDGPAHEVKMELGNVGEKSQVHVDGNRNKETQAVKVKEENSQNVCEDCK